MLTAFLVASLFLFSKEPRHLVLDGFVLHKAQGRKIPKATLAQMQKRLNDERATLRVKDELNKITTTVFIISGGEIFLTPLLSKYWLIWLAGCTNVQPLNISVNKVMGVYITEAEHQFYHDHVAEFNTKKGHYWAPAQADYSMGR